MSAHVRVKMRLLTTARGGRDAPIPPGEYRGVFASRGQQFSYRCMVPAGGIPLGSTVTLDVEFLFPELAAAFFKVMDEFNVWEGVTIGHGRVVKVL